MNRMVLSYKEVNVLLTYQWLSFFKCELYPEANASITDGGQNQCSEKGTYSLFQRS